MLLSAEQVKAKSPEIEPADADAPLEVVVGVPVDDTAEAAELWPLPESEQPADGAAGDDTDAELEGVPVGAVQLVAAGIAAATSAQQLTAAEFRTLALAQVGKRYVFGAEAKASDPNPKAFDCSELVEWLFARNGTPIGDLAASQWDRCGTFTGQPKVGDLVALANNPARWNRIGHIAVVTAKLSTGDYEIVEARGTSAGVVKTTLSYWQRRAYYAGVRRFAGFAVKPPPAGPVDDVRPARLVVDGDFGPRSTDALQWWLGVARSGSFDKATRKALQKRLDVTVDGVVGPVTTRALQRLVGLSGRQVDGSWGPVTTRALQTFLNRQIEAV